LATGTLGSGGCQSPGCDRVPEEELNNQPPSEAAPRVLAIDWSGAKSGARRKIWLAEARSGELVRLESGRNRLEMAEHLLDEMERDPRLLVGLDFAFSLPAWFLRDHDLTTAKELWQLADREAEAWLEECAPPFWGRPGRTKPDLPSHFRRTDASMQPVGGIRPKSPFQIGGGGAVGTASLRGMPMLQRLSAAGYRVWPFDRAEPPAVVEIYPRLLTGLVVKSSAKARADYVDARLPELSVRHRKIAASSEDALDAAVSAVVMSREAAALTVLDAATDPVELLEGRIWCPDSRDVAGSSDVARFEAEEEVGSLSGFLAALQFAAERHRDQRRKGKEASPYINHPIAVTRLLAEVGNVSDPVLLQAAILHDTVEDTETTLDELEASFGPEVRRVVEEVTDDKSLPKSERKRLQIERAPQRSNRAKQLKVADKSSNLIDIAHRPPENWTLERKQEYFDWAERVVEGCRGVNPALEAHFDEVLREARAVGGAPGEIDLETVNANTVVRGF
jgi:guanosine-3',5'-bis(diphosphate) 3'-pyrophosphohydrolase